MKRSNRVFFESMKAAVNAGFRPCAHCMPHAYRLWKKSNVDL
jgi:methylphosphotriester-DNA--protein-cysteine methyltransferase